MERVWVKNYQEGVPTEIDLTIYASISDMMQQAFRAYATLPAFHNMGKTLTFAELEHKANAFAGYLQNDLGLKKGERVAIMLPNILQYPICFYGILFAGMVVVNVNPLYTARELEHQLRDSGAKAIVIFENAAHILAQVIKNTEVRHILITGIGDLLGFPKAMIVNFVLKYIKRMVPPWKIDGHISFKRALDGADATGFQPVATTLEDLACLQYTGGTTGVSKGAMLTHGNIVANVLQAQVWGQSLLEKGKEIVITPLPLYHIFSMTINCLAFAGFGGLNVLITNPRDFAGFVKELGKWKWTCITGVNTLYNALLNEPGFADIDFSSVKICMAGGMAVQRSVADRWQNTAGTALVEVYGLTETSPGACGNPFNLKEYNGYIGLPFSSTEVVIKDDDGNNLPFNEVGEICVKGPQVMKGYWQRPDETVKVMSADGFLKTGDMGFMTEEGYVKIVDRKKDMINVSGFNVYPNEIEDIVAGHPKVLECAAIGIPDEKSGEAVKLFAVKKDDSLTIDELDAFCRSQLTGYKAPKAYEFRDELPKTNVGKILRKALREN